MMRKIAARMGLPNRTRNSCSNLTPTSPTGIVATMISHANLRMQGDGSLPHAAEPNQMSPGPSDLHVGSANQFLDDAHDRPEASPPTSEVRAKRAPVPPR
jgi:hypothetical protein